MTTGTHPDDLAARTRRHITRRLMPFLFVPYVFDYLNLVVLAFQASQSAL
jgi:hypothetical protein